MLESETRNFKLETTTMINEKDLPEEVKGGIIPNIDTEKLFDEKEYASIIIGSEGISKKDTNNSESIAILINSKSTREEKDEALKQLKENKAQAFMINAITKTKHNSHKVMILAACWETGLDFSAYYPFFIDLICVNDFSVSFEAFTVIQEMDAETDNTTLKTSLTKLKQVKEPSVIVTDSINWIEQKLTLH